MCINSYTLASGAWLGADVSRLVEWFPAHRLADGGWNCEAEEGNSVRSSFHSTLNALRGMLAYERITGDPALRDARHGGEEYLLERRLMYRATTGEVVGDFVSRFVSRIATGTARSSPSTTSAMRRLSRGRRRMRGSLMPSPWCAPLVQPDGTWLQGTPLPGRTWFDVDVPEGEPSKWLTLTGTRVLDWWDAASVR